MRELMEYVKREHKRLEEKYGIAGKEMALARMVKLAEETGETAEAVLSFFSLQREGKEKGDAGKEICDVIITAMLLAESLGIDIYSEMKSRLSELEERNSN